MQSLLLLLSVIVLLTVTVCNEIAYNIIIDAGSTGSRVYIYRYATANPLSTLTEIANKRINPAITSYIHDTVGINNYLLELVSYAKVHIEESMWATTPIALKATAGVRVIEESKQQWIIDSVSAALEKCGFLFDPLETKVITGQEEALYAFLAINAAFMDSEDFSFGAADLGGSSKQIAFSVPMNPISGLSYSHNSISDGSIIGRSSPVYKPCTPDYTLTLPGRNVTTNVLARSISGLGIVAARELVTQYINEESVSVNSSRIKHMGVEDHFQSMENTVDCSVDGDCIYTAEAMDWISNPCLSPGLRFRDDNSEDLHRPAGNFDACSEAIAEIIRVKASYEVDCMKVVRPRLIIGMDNFPKILEMMNLANESLVSPRDIQDAGRILCARPWNDVLDEFPNFMAYRAQRACFGASYIFAMVTEVYGIEIDDATSFLPLDNHASYTLGWPLGATLFSALNVQLSTHS